MQLLQVTGARVAGGLLEHVRILAGGLLARGHSLHLVVPPGDGAEPVARSAAAAGARVTRLRVRGKGDLGGLTALWRAVRRATPDLVHLHLASPVEGIPAILVLRGATTAALVATEHAPAWAPLRRRHSAPAKRAASRLLSAVVAVCQADAERLTVDYGLRRGLVEVIRNGVPPPGEMPERATARRALGLPGDVFLLGALGALEPRKGIRDLLVAAEVCDAGPLAVALGGRGALEEEIRAQRHRRAPVYLPGFVEPGTFLAALDLFVLPSHGESMPLALLQAMWAGLPIVATRVGGVPEAIRDGVSGLLVSPARPQELAAAIRRVAGDPDLASRLGAAARRAAEAEFSAGRMVGETEALYRRLLNT